MRRGGAVLSLVMVGGLIGLVAALVAATAIGLVLRRRSGRVRDVAAEAGSMDVLTPADLGAALGERATLVQFSTAFCAPCRPTRVILSQVADMVDGVVHVDVDATDRMDLVRRLRINSTPTVLILGPDGEVVRRAVGRPTKAGVLAALGSGSDSRVES
jgi:thiol-disulfide isomerase/thioredoxin